MFETSAISGHYCDRPTKKSEWPTLSSLSEAEPQSIARCSPLMGQPFMCHVLSSHSQALFSQSTARGRWREGPATIRQPVIAYWEVINELPECVLFVDLLFAIDFEFFPPHVHMWCIYNNKFLLITRCSGGDWNKLCNIPLLLIHPDCLPLENTNWLTEGWELATAT